MRFTIELDDDDGEVVKKHIADRGLTQKQWAKLVIMEAAYQKRMPSLWEIHEMKRKADDGQRSADDEDDDKPRRIFE